VFEIGKPVDSKMGEEIKPVVGTMPGLVTQLLRFECRIVLRSEKYAELIWNVEIEHPCEEGNASF